MDLNIHRIGSMFGHSPSVVADEVAKQVKKGITMMLPTPDSIVVGQELAKRFGVPYWYDRNNYLLFFNKCSGKSQCPPLMLTEMPFDWLDMLLEENTSSSSMDVIMEPLMKRSLTFEMGKLLQEYVLP